MTSESFWLALSELGLVDDKDVVLPTGYYVTVSHQAGKLKLWADNGDKVRIFEEFFHVSTYGSDDSKIGSEACFDIEHVYAITLARMDT